MKPDDKAVNEKLDELIALLADNHIDSDKAKGLRQRISKAIEGSGNAKEKDIKAFQSVDTTNASRLEMLDEFSILLSSHQIDSKTSKQYLHARGANFVLMAISIVLITLGLAMIIMPASPDFEIYTIIYFNPNDGLTIMDLISSLIVLTGIYLLIKSLYTKRPAKMK
ncbi:MAG: hypothetical protein EOP46_13105 [Sphingobacteriaceae bacterium]|nr:MAG: hypothetical protein EOP46_13105 [Sphingobacteriaceae bacterium]